MRTPVLTVVVPSYNEERFIRRCLESLLAQNTDLDFDVFVVDGMSEDRTVEIVREIVDGNQRPNIRVEIIDNPARRTPQALNLGIENARGSYVLILGAHTEVPPDWVGRSFDTIEAESGDVAMAGGKLESVPFDGDQGPFAGAIGYVTTTFWGGGVSEYRYSNKRQYVETAPFGIYRKEVLDEVGGFDPDFPIGQDGELSARIRKAGYRILFDPKIESRYFARSTLRKLVSQMFRYGVARSRIIKKHGVWKAVHFFPLVFVGYQAAAPALLFVNPLLLSPMALYALVTFAYSLGRPSSLVQNFVSYGTIHTVFGLGMALGFMPDGCYRALSAFNNKLKETI